MRKLSNSGLKKTSINILTSKPPLEVISSSSSHQNKFSDNEIIAYKQAHKPNEVITLDSSIDEIPITSKNNSFI
jgi:hypothetical protein